MKKRYISHSMMLAAALLVSTGTMAAGNQAYGTTNQKSDNAISGSQSAGTSGKAGQSASSSASVGQQNDASTIYLIVPVETFTVSDAMKNGCWARIYGDKNFTGDQLTLSGPFSLPKMVGPFGFNWKDKVHSIEVGRSATVTVYDNENFKDQVSQFKPGAKVADVSKRMGFFDNFSSMKISCGK